MSIGYGDSKFNHHTRFFKWPSLLQLCFFQFLQHGGTTRKVCAPNCGKLGGFLSSFRITVQAFHRLRHSCIGSACRCLAHLLIQLPEKQISHPLGINLSQCLFIFFELIGITIGFHLRHHLLQHSLAELKLPP